MYLTTDAPWQQSLFEAELLNSVSMPELNHAKASFPEYFRRAIMAQWSEDGRYEWLKDKAKAFQSQPIPEPIMFWSSRKESIPQIGSLVRVHNEPSRNRPYEVIERMRDENGSVLLTVRDEDGETVSSVPVEIFSYWPTQGDRVYFDVRQYLDWLIELRRVHATNSGLIGQIEARLKVYGAEKGHVGGNVMALYKPCLLATVEGAMGVVEMGEPVKAPLKVLIVSEKNTED
jgi:hypothetical protein